MAVFFLSLCVPLQTTFHGDGLVVSNIVVAVVMSRGKYADDFLCVGGGERGGKGEVGKKREGKRRPAGIKAETFRLRVLFAAVGPQAT